MELCIVCYIIIIILLLLLQTGHSATAPSMNAVDSAKDGTAIIIPPTVLVTACT